MSEINVIIGKCKSGKSTMSRQLVLQFLKNHFTEKGCVYLIKNDSMESDWIDEKYTLSPMKFGGNVDALLATVEQLSQIKKHKLIIFEDMLSILSPKDVQRVIKMLSVHRHTYSSYILITQTYKSLPSSLRSCEISDQCHLYLSQQKRKELIKDIYSELPVFDSMDQYESVNKSLKQYEFLHVDKEKFQIVKPKEYLFIIK